MTAVPTGPMLDAGQRRRICVAVLGALALALVLVVALADGPEAVSGRVGGDYPAFHAAGDLARADLGGSSSAFYDSERQASAQRPYLPPDEEGQLYFAYPAFFVAPYAALSVLDYRLAYLLTTVLMLAALAVALRVIRPMNRIAREYPLETFTVAVTFYPLFRGSTGGQNTALTLLLACLVWRFLHEDREVATGIVVALLLYKPPFALPFLGVLLVTRRWRGLGASAAIAALLYGLGSLLTDASWPSAWIDALRYLDEFDTPFNIDNYISLPGAAEAVFGIDSTAATVVGYGLAAVVALVVATLWLRSPAESPGSGRLDLLVAATAAAGVLVSPHAVFYDAGLVLLVALALADRASVPAAALGAAWLFGFAHLLAPSLGVSPLVLLVAAAFVLAIRELTADDQTVRTPIASDVA